MELNLWFILRIQDYFSLRLCFASIQFHFISHHIKCVCVFFFYLFRFSFIFYSVRMHFYWDHSFNANLCACAQYHSHFDFDSIENCSIFDHFLSMARSIASWLCVHWFYVFFSFFLFACLVFYKQLLTISHSSLSFIHNSIAFIHLLPSSHFPISLLPLFLSHVNFFLFIYELCCAYKSTNRLAKRE